MYRHILAPRDFSPTSEHALIRAIGLAELLRTDLHLLHAEVLYSDPVSTTAAESRATPVEAIRRRLGERPDGSPLETPVKVHVATVRDTAAAPAILSYAETHDIDLIVMGTHGRRGVRRLLLGSVTEEVMRTANCDVLAIREAGPPIIGRPIVAAVDFSTSSLRALERAREIATHAGSKLIVVHVAPTTPAFYGPNVGSKVTLPETYMEESRRALEAIYKSAGGKDDDDVEFIIVAGEPSRQLDDIAERRRAGLLVMGTRGLSGLKHVLVGSNTERTLRLTSTSVLATRLGEGEPLGVADVAVKTFRDQ